jgi:hypothetical protein
MLDITHAPLHLFGIDNCIDSCIGMRNVPLSRNAAEAAAVSAAVARPSPSSIPGPPPAPTWKITDKQIAKYVRRGGRLTAKDIAVMKMGSPIPPLSKCKKDTTDKKDKKSKKAKKPKKIKCHGIKKTDKKPKKDKKSKKGSCHGNWHGQRLHECQADDGRSSPTHSPHSPPDPRHRKKQRSAAVAANPKMPAESQSALNTAAAHKTAVAALSAALLKPSTRLGAIETLY